MKPLDSFSDSYVHHFGDEQNGKQIVDQGRERLMQNLRLAGVDNRATIQPGDMRQMPLEPASFDAIVSAYAIDHLDRQGMQKSIGEAARVYAEEVRARSFPTADQTYRVRG